MSSLSNKWEPFSWYVGMYVCMYVCRMSNHVESRESNTRMLKVSIGRPATPVLFASTILVEANNTVRVSMDGRETFT